ncbi:zinc uptake protein ZrgA [Aliamphritea spongicola]|uniref:zinc uptake protein ZrgA n=1 Tax=Aliamphritea spongicola TaxID=707589 RepID=UPI00196B744D|nr:DUF2796 domain-containing protein [Aliamphritea spongicola]MBN3563335.1 DUF2796 domain-containing protein [Aliamphritea spongicola]
MKMGLQQILIKDVADKQLLAICSRLAPEKQVRQRTSRALLFTSVLLASSMASTASQAGDDQGFERQLGSHQHGEAHLDIALDGNELVLSFTSPAANIVGFEYEPKTDKERQKVSDAKQFLLDAESWLGVPASAGCTLKEATFTASAEDHDDHDHEKHDDHDHEKHDDHDHDKHEDHDHEKHDDHDHEKHDDHDHEKHEDHDHEKHDDHDHEKHDDHEHDDHGHNETHSDWQLEYHLECSDGQAVTYLDVGLFTVYPALENIRVQAVGAQRQSLQTLTPQDSRFEF